jgi:hypothetical protein
MKFAIVLFKETNEVDVVSSTWLDMRKDGTYSGLCWYPPFKTAKRLQDAAREHMKVNKKTWAPYSARVLESYGKVLSEEAHFPSLYGTSFDSICCRNI